MTPYVEHAGLARVVLELTLAAFALAELATALRRRPDASPANVAAEAEFRVLFVLSILALAAGRALVPSAVIDGGAWTFALGAALGWLGLLLRWWSIGTLGRYFTTVVLTSDNQPVIETGPYRYLRHPSYAGLLLAFVGCGVMLGNWVGMVGSLAAIAVAILIRIRVEEAALAAALGDTYRAFARRRARLVPFVW